MHVAFKLWCCILFQTRDTTKRNAVKFSTFQKNNLFTTFSTDTIARRGVETWYFYGLFSSCIFCVSKPPICYVVAPQLSILCFWNATLFYKFKKQIFCFKCFHLSIFPVFVFTWKKKTKVIFPSRKSYELFV